MKHEIVAYLFSAIRNCVTEIIYKLGHGNSAQVFGVTSVK